VEARIGELLPPVHEARRIGSSEGAAIREGKQTNSSARPEGMNKHQAHAARAIARHPEAVAQVIAEAGFSFIPIWRIRLR
jgi:hypothetical protein